MSQDVLDAVYGTFKQDAEFMAFLGLTPSASPEETVKRIVRELEPDRAVIAANVPQVQIYNGAGQFSSRNYLVWEGKFVLDFYAKKGVNARRMSERAVELLHDKPLEHPTFRTFRTSLVHATDFATGIVGVKGYKAIYDVDFVLARRRD